MEQFFGILQRGLGQLDATGEYEEGTLRELKESYQKFDAAMQQNMLRVIEQSLAKFPITLQIYIWSSLLAVLRDEKIIPYMGELTADDSLNLWQKVELMNQLQRTIFASEMIKDEEAEYKRNSDAYTALMDEIRQRNKKEFSYLPWEKRNKKIVLITKQFIGRQHAPTEITLQMNRYLKELGYEVVLYVAYMPNRNTVPLWYKQCLWNNFMNTAGAFQGEIEGEELKGYNLLFTEEHYPEQLYDAAEMIWQEAPEWVLEVGDKTILADLCRQFTTVLTRRCVKTIPVTNAPIIVLASDYTIAEERRYQSWLKPYQQFVEVKHSIVGKTVIAEKEKKEKYGIAEDQFVILLVGNRLVQEVTEDFLKTIYTMLEENPKAVLAVIGNCEALEKRIAEAYRERFYFLGYTEELQKTMTIGDLFLNPPRQGGGTGAMYAILQEIPVVTLDNCDVQVNVGKVFTCDSIESMVNLVHQYCEDKGFMEKKKEACRRKAEQLGEALQRLGEEVEYFDVKQSGEAALAAYAGKTYQAVIGFQSYLFDIYLPKAGIYLHDLIKGPKINFQFDHPIWMKNHYIRMPEHCYSATHDRNYAAFIEKYYPRIAGSSIIFPGGCEKAAGENGKQEAERNLRGAQDKKEYQISFIGTYTDYRSYLPLIRNSQGIIKKIAAHFLFRMKQHPEETAEKALEESLRKDGIVLSDEEFLEVLDGVKPMIYCIMSYYREKAVKVILEAGITLEVFGDSWKKSPFGDSPYLRIHEAVDMRESLEVMEKSLISFNVMAWHKDGFTERIANSMLQHSVVLTDESTYLKEQFTDGKDILMYRLNELYKIQELLADYLEGAGRDNLQMIAENAYRKAKENYTWEQSAKKLLAFIDKIDAQERKCSEK